MSAPPPLRRLLLGGTVVGGVISAFGSHWALALSSAWLPVHLRTELGFGAARASVAVSSVSVLSLLLLLTVPALIDRRKRRGRAGGAVDGVAQGAAVLVSGAALALLPFAGRRPLQLVLIAGAFACHSVALPLHYMTTAAVVPPPGPPGRRLRGGRGDRHPAGHVRALPHGPPGGRGGVRGRGVLGGLPALGRRAGHVRRGGHGDDPPGPGRPGARRRGPSGRGRAPVPRRDPGGPWPAGVGRAAQAGRSKPVAQ
ncbi:hypothetical protein [Streptomyces sp. NPDC004783]|uniref:hypothetical protein n=1 Tax=Streptomyces sp. NPDC004783 TaxID=3154459 RepID=UPI0033B5FAD3